jgi:hypothetical protein
MKEAQIIKQLGALKGIQPDAGFAQSSKLEIIYSTPQRTGGVWMIAQSLSASLSIGLVIIFFVFVAVLGASSLRSPMSPALEGVNGDLVAEADTVNTTINIQLDEIQYVADVTAKALVRGEQNQTEPSPDEEIDSLLDEAINL